MIKELASKMDKMVVVEKKQGPSKKSRSTRDCVGGRNKDSNRKTGLAAAEATKAEVTGAEAKPLQKRRCQVCVRCIRGCPDIT